MGGSDPVQDIAGRQAGRVAWWQLRAVGVAPGSLHRWTKTGWLIPTRPRVYALGVVMSGELAACWDAILYAGPGAMLSHASAAHRRGLIRYPPGVVHVSTPRRVRSANRIHVHARRDLERMMHDGVPTTTPTQTMLDLAAGGGSPTLIRRALAQLDFQHELDLAALQDATGKGRLGTRPLRAAMERYHPDFGRLYDGVETEFYELLESVDFDPMPEVGVELEPGLIVDFFWRAHRAVVETDGSDNHDSPAQRLTDARRDLRCRQLGLEVIRYRRGQVRGEPALVVADLTAQLAKLRRLHGIDPAA